MHTAKSHGFTIVELLIVIVILAILVAVSIIAFKGIQGRASETDIKQGLAQNARMLEVYKVDNSRYPDTAMVPSSSTSIGAPTKSTAFQYTASSDGSAYCISGVAGSKAFNVSSANKSVASGVCPGHTLPDGYEAPVPVFDGITIGSQTWAKTNLNVGAMIAGTTDQKNNGIIEKYCYNNDESNCSTYGGLYKWSEAMQYSLADGAQGICPEGSHIPSDNDWKTLEKSLGMSQSTADSVGWRRTGFEGSALKSGGSSGLNVPLGGYLWENQSQFISQGQQTNLWTSTGDGNTAQRRILDASQSGVYRSIYDTRGGFSIRCLKN